ncbi:MAG TPA: FxsA family protein [Baekduia sp.]|uniref:FxsA family protein n=1 Tax=Baekduia sp. TaxID=2600305 RepID=UPI002D772AD3|nr:FxsA family protein [Baekduia sp.]HET6507642.1 FxsA family protein [Baekduia sp.]
MPFLLLLIFFVGVPILEIYVIIQVGEAIGALWTIVLLIADSILGTMLMRSQGRAVWRRFQQTLAEGRVPGREVLDGVLVIFGGAFLATPGFCSDAVGALLLLPPTRALVRRLIVRRFGFGMFGAIPGVRVRGGAREPHPGADVEGTATEIDPRRLP